MKDRSFRSCPADELNLAARWGFRSCLELALGVAPREKEHPRGEEALPPGRRSGPRRPRIPGSLVPKGYEEFLGELKEREERLWYARKSVESGWSRNVLVHWIESDLYRRQGKAQTNFEKALPAPQSDLARETLKDPYKFEFLSLGSEAAERELEEGLLAHIRKFLIELGAGFAFVGQQVHLEIGGEDFFVDLLFYHLEAPGIRGDRPQDDGVQAGVRREDELLFIGGGRPPAPPR